MDIAKERTAEEWKDTVRNKRHGPTRTRAQTPLDRVTDPAVVLGGRAEEHPLAGARSTPRSSVK